MPSIKKVLITGAVIVAAAAGAGAYFLMPERLNVDTVQKATVVQTVKVTGNIRADEAQTLYAPVSGRLAVVSVEAGDAVSESQVIASYDTTLIENDYLKAAAALDASRQGYEAAVSENDKASGKFAEAKALEQSSRNELEVTLALLTALQEANRGDYLEPSDHSTVLDIETRLKTLEQDIQINLADKAAAEGRLENAKSYKASYEVAYKEAKLSYQSAKDAFEAAASDPLISPEDLESLQKSLSDAEAAYKTTKKQYEDIKDQIDDAEDDVDEAEGSLSGNRSSLSSALTQLDEINKRNYSKTMSDEEFAMYTALESRLKIIEQDLTKSLTDRQYNESKLINSHTIKQYEHNVDASEADADSADYTLSLAREGVVADKSGVILEKFVDSNAMVEAGTPICTLQPTGNIKVEAMISKFDIDKIDIRQEADVTVGASVYRGFVSKIFPVAEKDSSGKPKVKIWIDLDVSDTIPTIGLEAQVVIHAGEAQDALCVPYESVYSDDGGAYVYVLDGSTAVKKYVQTGIQGNDRYSITEGLKEGESVILTPFSDERLEGRYMKD